MLANIQSKTKTTKAFMKPNEILVNGKTFRCVLLIRHERQHGYVGTSEEYYNVLQYKRKFLGLFSFWFNKEMEHVPSFAVIERGIFGYTNWQSPLVNSIHNKTHPIFIS